MAGFGMAMQGGKPGAAPEMEETGQDEPESNVTPEEQAIYDRFINNALKVVYPEQGDEKISSKVLQGLRGSGNPVMNLATTAVTLVTGLRDSAKQAGAQVPDDVLFHAGAEIVEELAEASDAAKIYDYSEKEIESAFYMALDMYREAGTQSGDVDPEALKQQFAQIDEADKAGRIGELLPGIEARAKEDAA